jgi:hypothetical protein
MKMMNFYYDARALPPAKLNFSFLSLFDVDVAHAGGEISFFSISCQ